jgi:hypothetical protein
MVPLLVQVEWNVKRKQFQVLVDVEKKNIYMKYACLVLLFPKQTRLTLDMESREQSWSVVCKVIIVELFLPLFTLRRSRANKKKAWLLSAPGICVWLVS